MKELLGALIAGASALLYDAGYVLEKQALTDLPPVRIGLTSLWHTATTSRRWLVGFVAMLAGLALQVMALTLAPVSVVQPILAGGLIALAAVGSSVLGERLASRQITALVLILAAVVAVAVSARSEEHLATAVPGGRILILGSIACVLAFGLVAADRRRGTGRNLAFGAVAAGLLYGFGAVAEKAVSIRLADQGLVKGAISSLGTPYPWLFAVVTAGGLLVFQAGLQVHPASLMAALTNVTSTVCALVGAATVFGEDLLPPGGWAVVRILGFAAALAAVALVASAEPDVRPGRPESALPPGTSGPMSVTQPSGGPPSASDA
ncbi:MAG TPA: DMT family transporter [Acidimicrobiales bacterium]|jgi:multidrug transporter EmrE-like cation transporter|nr:DMT family transporter [Acidimicrobiales bacterium]